MRIKSESLSSHFAHRLHVGSQLFSTWRTEYTVNGKQRRTQIEWKHLPIRESDISHLELGLLFLRRAGPMIHLIDRAPKRRASRQFRGRMAIRRRRQDARQNFFAGFASPRHKATRNDP